WLTTGHSRSVRRPAGSFPAGRVCGTAFCQMIFPGHEPVHHGNLTMQDIHAQRVLILDFGSQYTQLIARRVREIGVYCEIRPFDMDEAEIKAFAPRGIILSGGPETVTVAETPRAPQ